MRGLLAVQEVHGELWEYWARPDGVYAGSASKARAQDGAPEGVSWVCSLNTWKGVALPGALIGRDLALYLEVHSIEAQMAQTS